MAKQSGGKPQIDEDFMKEIISQGLPVKKQETPSAAMETKIETPDKPDDKTGTVEMADKGEIKAEPKEEKTVKEPARRKKNAPCDYRGNLFHAGGLDRPPAVIRQPYHSRKADEDRNRYRRTQGDREQLCRKYPAPAFRPVSGRDKRTVRKQI